MVIWWPLTSIGLSNFRATEYLLARMYVGEVTLSDESLESSLNINTNEHASINGDNI